MEANGSPQHSTHIICAVSWLPALLISTTPRSAQKPICSLWFVGYCLQYKLPCCMKRFASLCDFPIKNLLKMILFKEIQGYQDREELQ